MLWRLIMYTIMWYWISFVLECCCRKLKKNSQKYQRTVGYPSTSWASCLHCCGIEDFRRFLITISHTSHPPIFTKLGEMTDADKAMNPQYFAIDPAEIQIRIRINPKIGIRIPDHFRLIFRPWWSFAL